MAVDRAANSGWPHRRRFAVATTTLCLLSAAAAGYGADLIGNGMSDVLWRLPAGNPLIWEMSGLSLQGQVTVSNTLDAGSAIVGTGKFFGNGSPDAIAWVSSSDQLTLWLLGSDGSVQQSCTNTIAPDLDFLGIGDIDGDGTDDILWRSATDGSVSAYLMNGCATTPQALALQSIADPSWTFAGAGDINGDGYADLIWQDSQSGNVIIWLSASGGVVTQEIFPENAQSGWKIAAIGDFDGNGKADLLWRDPVGNNLDLWLFNGTSYTVASVPTPDTIFANDFDTSASAAPSLTSDWTILAAADYTGDGKADLLLADAAGRCAIWQMQGATVVASALLAPHVDMPFPGLTGWRLPLDRPKVTLVNGQVNVGWNNLAGSATYTAYASAAHDPANTGVPSQATSPFSFGRNDPEYSDKRYFAVTATYHGLQLPPSSEAYILEFSQSTLPYAGALAVADMNSDGCIDVLGALGDCAGDFALLAEADMGLGALRGPNRWYRDLRFADLDGDGIDDAIANVYSSIYNDDSRVLYFHGIGNSHFKQDLDFPNIQATDSPPGYTPSPPLPGIRGYGETIVIADFNNDGYLDIFLPHYSSVDPPYEHSWLLLNDGTGQFTDVSFTAGVAMTYVPLCARAEGAQAVDIDSDGWIDIYTGSKLLRNTGTNAQGIPIFQDLGPIIDPNCNTVSPSPVGLNQIFDEGAKFIDLDNSGQLALVLNTVDTDPPLPGTPPGIHVEKFDGVGHFTEQYVIPTVFMEDSNGLTAADVDGDGLTDLIVAGGCDASYGGDVSTCNQWGNPHALPQLFLNRGGVFVLADFYADGRTPTTRGDNTLQASADFDLSGTIDILSLYQDSRSSLNEPCYPGFGDVYPCGYIDVLMNKASSFDTLVVSVLGANGEQNQQGRVVRVTPNARPDVTMTQVVDGGSGYMSNGPYDLTFATPYFGAYTVSVRFAGATYTAVAHSGDHVTMSANGTYAIQPAR